MGFYLRKSISLGGIRFNLSKSGVGISTGIKGFRIGSGPHGNYIHIGTNGYYYRKTIGNTNKPLIQTREGTSHSNNALITQETYNFQEIESGNVSFMTDSSFNDILIEINKKSKRFPFISLGIAIPIILFFIKPILILFIVLTLSLGIIIDNKRKTTYLIYDIDEQKEASLQTFYNAFSNIINSSSKWHISSNANLTKQYDVKMNAGANNLVKRSKTKIGLGVPKYFKTNVRVPFFCAGKQILYFFPERILIKDGWSYGTINYDQLEITYNNCKFIETEIIPRDTKIIGKTWKYVNKNGGPDKRFKDNREIPIALYSELHFKSSTGLNELFSISKPDIGEELATALKQKTL